MALVYKLLEDGSGIQMDDGHPIVIDDEDDNREFPILATELYSKIPALQLEAKKSREEKQKLQKILEPFGDKDPNEVLTKLTAFGDISADEAKTAIQTVANLGDLDKDKNIEIEKVQAKITANYEEKMKNIDLAHANALDEVTNVVAQKDNLIRNLLIRGAFDRSEFIRDQTVLTPDIAYNSFGKFFRIEEDGDEVKVFALDRKGEKIFSKTNPAEYASTEEAIGLIIQGYSQKDSIMRTSPGGSGAGGNKQMNNSKKAKLEEIKKLPPAQRLVEMRKLA